MHAPYPCTDDHLAHTGDDKRLNPVYLWAAKVQSYKPDGKGTEHAVITHYPGLYDESEFEKFLNKVDHYKFKSAFQCAAGDNPLLIVGQKRTSDCV